MISAGLEVSLLALTVHVLFLDIFMITLDCLFSVYLSVVPSDWEPRVVTRPDFLFNEAPAPFSGTWGSRDRPECSFPTDFVLLLTHKIRTKGSLAINSFSLTLFLYAGNKKGMGLRSRL